jgi:hypothetical protein
MSTGEILERDAGRVGSEKIFNIKLNNLVCGKMWKFYELFAF